MGAPYIYDISRLRVNDKCPFVTSNTERTMQNHIYIYIYNVNIEGPWAYSSGRMKEICNALFV